MRKYIIAHVIVDRRVFVISGVGRTYGNRPTSYIAPCLPTTTFPNVFAKIPIPAVWIIGLLKKKQNAYRRLVFVEVSITINDNVSNRTV